jgi:gluconolactonase
MKRLSALYCFLLVLGIGFAQAQQTSGSVLVRLDPALDRIVVAADAKVEKVYESPGPSAFEGPTWLGKGRSGFFVFSDITGNVINKLDRDDKVSVYVDHIFQGADTSLVPKSLGDGSALNLGSNGTTKDPQGRLVYCAEGNRRIERLEKDGTRTVLADKFEGRPFNVPNDLVFKSDGALYFTDTRVDAEHGQPFAAVYLVKNGKVQVLTKDLTTPNGLAFSPDEKYLYVIQTMKKQITRFDVKSDDTIANGQLFIDMNADKAPGVPDGMRLDKKGNIYCTGPGGLWIISPDGKHLGTILVPQVIRNVSFGAPDGKTIYMAAAKAIFRTRVKAVGLRPW